MIIESGTDEQSAQLLSQANLHRMRRQWDDAVSTCMQALYYSPDNWAAHSVLGDIAADQGKPDEAIQWYCMALDIKPDSSSVREKLSKIVNSRRHEIVQSIDPTQSFMPQLQANSKPSVTLLMDFWHDPQSRIKLIAGIGAALIFVILLVAIAYTSGIKSQANPSFATGSVPTDTSIKLQPVTNPQPPVPIPTRQPVTNPPTISSGAPPSGTQLTKQDDPTIINSLNTDPGLRSLGIIVKHGWFEPLTGRLTFTFSFSPNASQDPTLATMQNGIIIAKVALQRWSNGLPGADGHLAPITLFTVCGWADQSIDPTVPESVVPTFLGSASSLAINTAGNISKMSASDLSKVYTNEGSGADTAV